MYKLVSFNLCPYVQRAVTVLNEKGVDYDIQYIDLGNKPDWFLKLSPTGKVPVLQLDANAQTGNADSPVLFESGVICEFLDESHEPRLLPDAPLARARDRMWAEYVGNLYGSVYRMQMSPDEKTVRNALEEARTQLMRVEDEISGPLFNGEALGMVDVYAASALMRLTWMEELTAGSRSLDAFEGLPKIAAWRDALLARESVQNAVLAEIYDIFVESAEGRGAWIARAQ